VKKLNNILVTLILISSINILSQFTSINFIDFFTPAYANQQSKNSEFIILKSRDTETSIYIEKGAKVKIDRDGDTKFNKMRQYAFQFYNPHSNTITLENKKTGVISVSADDLNSISIRLDNLKKDNMLGAMAGGFFGAGIGSYPSALLGWVIGVTMENSSNSNSALPGLTCMGITAAGTILSAKLGYNTGKNIGNPYIHIPLNGEHAWDISSQ
jgi:tetrahydromethanopterin S-methyltransferase subunit G